jgi:hypothetical protein
MADEKKTAKDVTTPIGRLMFVHLFKPRAGMDPTKDEPRYETNLLIKPKFQKTAAHKALQSAVVECAQEFFGEKVDLKKIRLPFKKGADMPYEGVDDGDIVIRAWSKSKPGVVDADMMDVLAPEDVYAGQWARLNIRPFAYDTSGNKGVSFALNHVQTLKDDLRLDGRKSAQDTFGGAGLDDDASDLLAEVGVDKDDDLMDDADDLLSAA